MSFSAFALCDTTNLTFNIKPYNSIYLRYFDFENAFDSAVVTYTIGEFVINNSSTSNRININESLSTSFNIYGDTLLGEDSTLKQYCITSDFLIPPNSQVKFFRKLQSYIPCNIENNDNPGEDLGGTGDWRDKWWRVGLNRILDKTEWVVQLVRKSDNYVICNLDSVGVAPNPYSRLAQRYGTGPDTMNIIRNIPNGYENTIAYIRISPRRWGPTPYGISMRVIDNWVAFSNIFEYDSLDIIKCSVENMESIHNHYFNEVIEYCDSLKNTQGYVGLLPYYIILFDNNQLKFYYDRYFDTLITSIGDTILYEELLSPPSFPTNINWLEKINEKLILDREKIKIVMRPSLTSRKVFDLFIDSYIEENIKLKIDIYNISGEKIKNLSNNFISKGLNFATLDLSSFTSGYYIIIISSFDGLIFYYYKIIL